MRTRIERWHNDLVIRIPQPIADKMGLQDGVAVDVELVRGELRICHADAQPSPTLEELVSQITDENRHPECDWGPPMGREVW